MLGIEEKTSYVIDHSFIVFGDAYTLQFHTSQGDEVMTGLCTKVQEMVATFVVASNKTISGYQEINIHAAEIAAGNVNILGRYAWSEKPDCKKWQKIMPPVFQMPETGFARLLIDYKAKGITLCHATGYTVTFCFVNPDTGFYEFDIKNPNGERKLIAIPEKDVNELSLSPEKFWKEAH